MDARRAAAAFAELFPEVYRALHARRRPGELRPTMQSMAVLEHLAFSGPLTVTEAARHLGRAQSVISEIVEQLEAKGLLARMPDARDRRRHLVWLTEAGQALRERQREVLEPEPLAAAMARLRPAQRAALIETMGALARAANGLTPKSNRRKR